MSYSVTFSNQSINLRYSRRLEVWEYVHKTSTNETNVVSFNIDAVDGLIDLILFEINSMRAEQHLNNKDHKIVVDMNTMYKKMVLHITKDGVYDPNMINPEDDEKVDEKKNNDENTNEESEDDEDSDDDDSMEMYEQLLHIFMQLEPNMSKTEKKR
jgi:hypothetical protein